ncbi:hypothetical protein B0T14DRAFT_212646 [Immersiella caudata]|uniref:Uncharacterized protein n=1 Tax=Immersiella caudata TaxID=314043 RepID=A0AA39WR10_9PEZI|nr:hypothetical protein B0T14DRAFT_212646 [Immersiella caudata]
MLSCCPSGGQPEWIRGERENTTMEKGQENWDFHSSSTPRFGCVVTLRVVLESSMMPLEQKALSLFCMFEYSFELVLIEENCSRSASWREPMPLSLDPTIASVTVGLAVGMAVVKLSSSTLVSQSVAPCLASAVPAVATVLENTRVFRVLVNFSLQIALKVLRVAWAREVACWGAPEAMHPRRLFRAATSCSQRMLCMDPSRRGTRDGLDGAEIELLVKSETDGPYNVPGPINYVPPLCPFSFYRWERLTVLHLSLFKSPIE